MTHILRFHVEHWMGEQFTCVVDCIWFV